MKQQMLKKILRTFAFVIAAIACMIFSSCGEHRLDADNPVTISIWNYYNGIQQQVFNRMVNEFNETEGSKLGIVVETHSRGTVSELADSVIASIDNRVGAEELPDIFAAYADTAYTAYNAGKLADISQYMSKDECDEYIQSYLDEGKFDSSGSYYIFPIAKSTEVLLVNDTEWKKFAEGTGVSTELLSTWEGICEVAEKYYLYSGGKAFFGRDAYANYIIIGTVQLGHEIFTSVDGNVTADINPDVMRRLWDNFYVPYVRGYFASYGRYRSDDMKTGGVVAMVCSTSGASYTPSEITREDGSTYPVDMKAYPLPNFEGCNPYAVQQGAGMVIVKSTEQKQYAAAVFLKWFTESERNIQFSLESGYLPVKKSANDNEYLNNAMAEMGDMLSPIMRQTVTQGAAITRGYTLYTTKAFKNGYKARNILEDTLIDAVKAALKEINAQEKNGVSHDVAEAAVLTEAVFDKWLADFSVKLNDAVLES